MNAQALASFGTARVDAYPPTARCAAVNAIELAGARVHLEDPTVGVVPAWYLDAKPRGAAAIVPLPSNAWQDGQPAAAVRARVATLQQQGVSVLLVDARRRGILALCFGADARAYVRAARGYLEDRGHCPDDIEVVRAA